MADPRPRPAGSEGGDHRYGAGPRPEGVGAGDRPSDGTADRPAGDASASGDASTDGQDRTGDKPDPVDRARPAPKGHPAVEGDTAPESVPRRNGDTDPDGRSALGDRSRPGDQPGDHPGDRHGDHPRRGARRDPGGAASRPRRPAATTARGHRSGPSLHPGAWWLWALGLGTAATRTTNPLLLCLLATVSGYVVATRRPNAPWARSYGAFVKLALAVLVIRLLFAIVLGSPIPGSHVLVSLPEVPLPAWAQGIRLGGDVTAEALTFALYDGLKLATLLVCVGAANALANPSRLLKSLPGALYEMGVAVVVAMTFAPNLIADVQRLRAARRLRGRPDKGVRGLLQVGLPVLEGALERSVALAAAMDARGYGRTAEVPPAVRRTTAALTLGGLLGVCAGTYGLLTAEGGRYGLPVLLAGLATALAGLWLGGRRSLRTRYRPDHWDVRAWLVAGSGAAVAAALFVAAARDPAALHPGVVPLVAPTLPLWPAAAVLIGLLPAFVTPAPEDNRKEPV